MHVQQITPAAAGESVYLPLHFLVAEWRVVFQVSYCFFLKKIFKLAVFYFTIGQVRSQPKKTFYKGREGINPNLVMTRVPQQT